MLKRTAIWTAWLVAVAGTGSMPSLSNAGDCGCDTRYCGHHCRCRHHCCESPPYGMVVPSAPAYAAPLVAAPLYAAPAMYAAPLNYAPQAAPQCNSSQSAYGAPGASSTEQLTALLRAALAPNGTASAPGPAAAPSVPPDTTLEDRVSKIEQRVNTLEQISRDLSSIVKSHEQRLKTAAP